MQDADDPRRVGDGGTLQRFVKFYEHLRAARDPVALIRSFSDEEVAYALAGAATRQDAYISNVLATEVANRLHRSHRELEDLRDALDTLDDGVVVVEREGTVVFANAEACRILGRHRDDLARLRITDPAVGITTARVRILGGASDGAWAEAIRSGEGRRGLEVAVLRPDGSRTRAVCTLSPLRDSHGAANSVSVRLREER